MLKRLTHFLEDAASGAAAVEFAIVLPFLLILIFGIFAASAVTATVNGLEQISAGAARSSVAGQSDTERVSLVNAFIAGNVGAYPYIDPRALVIATSGDPATKTFTVRLVYDLSGNRILSLVRDMFPATPSSFTRSAVVVQGGT